MDVVLARPLLSDLLKDSLAALYGFTVDDAAQPFAGHATDGEAVWLEQRDLLVVVTKNIPPAAAATFAEAAMGSPAAGKPIISAPRKRLSLPELIYRFRSR